MVGKHWVRVETNREHTSDDGAMAESGSVTINYTR